MPSQGQIQETKRKTPPETGDVTLLPAGPCCMKPDLIICESLQPKRDLLPNHTRVENEYISLHRQRKDFILDLYLQAFSCVTTQNGVFSALPLGRAPLSNLVALIYVVPLRPFRFNP